MQRRSLNDWDRFALELRDAHGLLDLPRVAVVRRLSYDAETGSLDGALWRGG
jgi:hypothetical protein